MWYTSVDSSYFQGVHVHVYDLKMASHHRLVAKHDIHCVTFICKVWHTGVYHLHGFNPFTAPACKISGLKDAQWCLQTVYSGPITHLPSVLCDLVKILLYASVKKASGFQISDFNWAFSCDIMAVKGWKFWLFKWCLLFARCTTWQPFVCRAWASLRTWILLVSPPTWETIKTQYVAGIP